MVQTISQINIYPLKSAAPITLESALLTNAGLENDRRLMLIDAAGICVTAREFPNLLLIHTQINPERYQFNYHSDGIDINSKISNNEKTKVNIHGAICKATLVSHEADQWFSNALNIDCRLVAMNNDDVRNVEVDSNGHEGDVVSFADEHALLLTCQSSLDDLNARLDTPVGMKNFRPNLVVTGTQAFAEDSWERIRIGDNEFRVAQTCQRCKLTTIDPETAQVREDKEPLKTMIKFRRNKTGSGVDFGIHIAPVGKMSDIKLNDEVSIIS